ncbi:MAG TPA: glycosyltransferase family 4 protein [Gemmataceae bacterium]|nr:glycosyltransferase family 4 protein [Gemmataceae bacterium]
MKLQINRAKSETPATVGVRFPSVQLAPDAQPIEFAGWLPIFEYSGDCGRHPQFKHTASPPPGYRFTCSAARPRGVASIGQRGLRRLMERVNRIGRNIQVCLRPFRGIFRGISGVGPRARLRILAAIVRLFFRLRGDGARLGPVLRFLQSRHYQSQLLLAHYRGPVFLPSVPYTYGQNPWMVEIEDPTTLFYPLIQNGGTFDLNIAASPYFPIIKSHLESDACKGIITHMRSTAEMVTNLFDSATITSKIFHVPLGVKLPERWQRHEEDEQGPIDLLFTNSWHQQPGNFYLRGGVDILEAFAILRHRYPQLRLTLRTRLPNLHDRYHRIIEKGWVRVIDRFLSVQEMETLLSDSHIYLLPAARIHIVSVLQAMAHGLVVVASDGWGFEEYVTHERNGLVVKGRYGKVSWVDPAAGMLREDYAPMYTPDPKVVRGLVKAIARLVENSTLRKRLGRTAHHDVQTTYNLERWNAGLKQAFDKAFSGAVQL